MNICAFAALTGLALSITPGVHAQPPAASITLRYKFTPGQTLRYLIQRDPYFADPAGAIETADPSAPYRPPIVERLTEEVQSVGRDGAATLKVTVAPEPGFEDEVFPQTPVTRIITVTPFGQVLLGASEAADEGLLRAFFRLPSLPVRPGAAWKGTAFRGKNQLETDLALAAMPGASKGLAVIRQTLPITATESRSPDHDGTLLQTTRSGQADRIVFDTGAGSLVRQSSTLTVTVSLVMTGRGKRGGADFGRVIPNVQAVQTMTIERRNDLPTISSASPTASSPASLPASTARR